MPNVYPFKYSKLELLQEIEHLYNQNKGNFLFHEIMFLIFSLNHLREWHCPENDHLIGKNKTEPITAAEVFFCKIYESEEFRMINKVCNGFKHVNKCPDSNIKTKTLDEWGDMDGVRDFDLGEKPVYIVERENGDKENLENAIGNLIATYKKEFGTDH
tara:strand:- start:125 stop:598 length:474 start_codon:yes stop_codon:yes gene_type:complete